MVDLPPLLETPMRVAKDVAIAAFAPLPKAFGEKDRQRLAVAVRVLADGTAEYSRSTIFDTTEGRTVEAALLPDGVMLRLVLPRENLRNGLAIMEGLLRRPMLMQERLDAMLVRMQRHEKDYWSAALIPQNNALKSVSVAEERALLGRVFRPEKTVVSVVGGFDAGAPRALWVDLTSDWRGALEPRYPDISPTPDPVDNPSGVTTVELRAAPLAIDGTTLPARWLALFALGVGKGASLFRDVRQVEGWSYRQEAILWPDPEGLRPRIVAALAPEAGEADRAEGLRTTLRNAVARWTEPDRARALAMASMALVDGSTIGPLWLGDLPPGGSLADRAALDAYWFAKARVRWEPAQLLSAMRGVPLEVLKAEADAMLKEARPLVLPGR